jgi:hypothetical protein
MDIRRSGGSSDTDAKELDLKSSGRPLASRVVITVTPEGAEGVAQQAPFDDQVTRAARSVTSACLPQTPSSAALSPSVQQAAAAERGTWAFEGRGAGGRLRLGNPVRWAAHRRFDPVQGHADHAPLPPVR